MQKLYVIVRDDLSFPQKAVQAGHAATEWVLHHNKGVWTNGTLIYLIAKNLQHLSQLKEKLFCKGIIFAEFIEPDLGNELTAIACLGTNSVVKKLPMLQ